MSHALADSVVLHPRVVGPCGTAHEAASRFLAAGGERGRVGVVLGTGLGELADRLSDVFMMPSQETGYLPASTATGHAGRVMSGWLGDTPVVVLQGRVHGYEGFSADVLCRGVDLLASLGVEHLLLTNAAGGLDPQMQPGDLVVLRDHIDFVRLYPASIAGSGSFAREQPRPGRVQRETYARPLVEQAVAAAAGAGYRCRSGIYLYVCGPTYETRAEYRMFRQIGGDVVGMSTVPEAVHARHLGMQVTAASVVTNVANPDAMGVTEGHQVCAAAARAAEGVWAMLRSVARASKPPRRTALAASLTKDS